MLSVHQRSVFLTNVTLPDLSTYSFVRTIGNLGATSFVCWRAKKNLVIIILQRNYRIKDERKKFLGNKKEGDKNFVAKVSTRQRRQIQNWLECHSHDRFVFCCIGFIPRRRSFNCFFFTCWNISREVGIIFFSIVINENKKVRCRNSFVLVEIKLR